MLQKFNYWAKTVLKLLQCFHVLFGFNSTNFYSQWKTERYQTQASPHSTDWGVFSPWALLSWLCLAHPDDRIVTHSTRRVFEVDLVFWISPEFTISSHTSPSTLPPKNDIYILLMCNSKRSLKEICITFPDNFICFPSISTYTVATNALFRRISALG